MFLLILAAPLDKSTSLKVLGLIQPDHSESDPSTGVKNE